jgi:hypothetical protein
MEIRKRRCFTQRQNSVRRKTERGSKKIDLGIGKKAHDCNKPGKEDKLKVAGRKLIN